MLFSNGCTIEPVLCTVNGTEKYRFIVTSFEDDVYFNGTEIPLRENADTLNELIACEFERNNNCSLREGKCNGCGFIETFKNKRP